MPAALMAADFPGQGEFGVLAVAEEADKFAHAGDGQFRHLDPPLRPRRAAAVKHPELSTLRVASNGGEACISRP
jgi:hypothetical protein